MDIWGFHKLLFVFFKKLAKFQLVSIIYSTHLVQQKEAKLYSVALMEMTS